MTITTRTLAAAALFAAAIAAGSVQAQTDVPAGWPDRPLRMIVPFPAGSSGDVVCRLVMHKMSERIGQQVVVENRVGASGALGSDAVAKAAPDGYTIGLATTSTHSVAASLTRNLPYDPVTDFAPLGMIGDQPYVLVVANSVPAKSVAELVELAKKQPGKLNYGSAGPASLAHLAGSMFASIANVDINHVPYRSSAQSQTDLISGRLEMQFATPAPTLPTIKANQVRALATTGEKRSSALPEVPTMIEAGVKGYEASLWMGLVMPPKTPAGIVARLNKELNGILESKEIADALAVQAMDADPGPPEKLTRKIKADIAKWRDVAVKAGLDVVK
jgi:tripartite-type tricarboxylate transporter receptor subunit TctC